MNMICVCPMCKTKVRLKDVPEGKTIQYTCKSCGKKMQAVVPIDSAKKPTTNATKNYNEPKTQTSVNKGPAAQPRTNGYSAVNSRIVQSIEFGELQKYLSDVRRLFYIAKKRGQDGKISAIIKLSERKGTIGKTDIQINIMVDFAVETRSNPIPPAMDIIKGNYLLLNRKSYAETRAGKKEYKEINNDLKYDLFGDFYKPQKLNLKAEDFFYNDILKCFVAFVNTNTDREKGYLNEMLKAAKYSWEKNNSNDNIAFFTED